MVDIITSIVGPLISGLVALFVCTQQNDKLMALVQYRIEQLEKKVDAHNQLSDKYVKLETEINMLKTYLEK